MLVKLAFYTPNAGFCLNNAQIMIIFLKLYTFGLKHALIYFEERYTQGIRQRYTLTE